MKPNSKSMSCRILTEEFLAFQGRAAERQLKPAVLMSQIISGWLNGDLVPQAETNSGSRREQLGTNPLEATEWARLESFLCRAVWTLIVALSPTLDEESAQTIVNEMIQPVSRDWGE
jgi:hypothetical protein